MPIVKVIVRGRVQGVGFRDFVMRNAGKYGAEGWVRNCRNGSVEVLFSGPDSVVQTMLDACHRGPLGSRVDGVEKMPVNEGELALRHSGEAFSRLETA
jgi:acylphosphatase